MFCSVVGRTKLVALIGACMVLSFASAAFPTCSKEEEAQISQAFGSFDSEKLAFCYDIILRMTPDDKDHKLSYFCRGEECSAIVQQLVDVKVPECAWEIKSMQQQVKTWCNYQSDAPPSKKKSKTKSMSTEMPTEKPLENNPTEKPTEKPTKKPTEKPLLTPQPSPSSAVDDLDRSKDKDINQDTRDASKDESPMPSTKKPIVKQKDNESADEKKSEEAKGSSSSAGSTVNVFSSLVIVASLVCGRILSWV